MLEIESDIELILPYGGGLASLIKQGQEADRLREEALRLPSVQLSDFTACDLELLATGAFSPLDRFMNAKDFRSVVHDMCLADSTLFPVPVTLPVERRDLPPLDSRIALRDSRNELLAVMDVEEIYEWDADDTALRVCGTVDMRHPMVARMHGWGGFNLSGRLSVLALPAHHDFHELRLTPRQARARLRALGRKKVVAFQTRNPMHRAHEEMTRRAAEAIGGTLLVHPVVGLSMPGDIDHYTRVRSYRALIANHYPPGSTLLSLLPLAMRMAGPREALWHAIIRRNFGASHIIVGRDHAGPGSDSAGRPFYRPYEAHEMLEEHAGETGVTPVGFGEFVYVPSEDRYEQKSLLSPTAETLSLSGTRARRDYLDAGRPLPSWFTRPEVARILAEGHRPRHRQGVCVWFTGLSCSGKSTTAELLSALLLERGRRVTVLDGDVVRTNLSRGLGFSREDRDTNILRIGYVASEIVRHGGVAVCAAISPYTAARESVRRLIGEGRFIEVFVDTPLEVCEQRDSKGMYARARAGEIRGFTGIDDPYEPPLAPEMTLDTVDRTAEQNACALVDHLSALGFLKTEEALA